jgi:hypothetical protein
MSRSLPYWLFNRARTTILDVSLVWWLTSTMIGWLRRRLESVLHELCAVEVSRLVCSVISLYFNKVMF